MVIWLIGLSGSGKTTIANLLFKRLKKKYINIVHLDGDQVRKIYGEKIGHITKDRYKNAERLSRLSKFLSDQKIHVIASVLSNFPEWQKWNKKNIKNYFQIYLKVSLKTLIKRDNKKLYKKNIKGNRKNIVGVDIKFIEPINSDLIIENEKNIKSFKKMIDRIIKKINII